METNQTSQRRVDVYDLINTRIITQLEKGVVPWRKSWSESGLPQNLITRKPYKGVNLMLLSSLGYQENYFLTFQQAKELGATVRKDEKGIPIIFWKWVEKEDTETHEKKKKALLRYYWVFNVRQCDGIPEGKIPEVAKPNDPIEECEYIVSNMPKRPQIYNGAGGPYYHPILDFINLPAMKDFKNSESYYETLFHEMIHSTGHESRLNRKEIVGNDKYGSESYSQEELTAEIGACYLKSHAGLKEAVLENNVAYIQGWLKKLSDDKRCIVYASAQAQHAVDFIMNMIPKSETEQTMEVSHE